VSWPDIRQLVPHTGPMCLLDRVVAHDKKATTCSVRVEDSTLFLGEAESVPAWLGIEYLAQCIAVHGGLEAAALGQAPRPGLFLGSRRLALRVAELPTGVELLATVRHLRGSGAGLQAFACALLPEAGADPWIEGNLNVMLNSDIEPPPGGLP
jgi:predicted hotdog family 3-hydroxylacyl-ACP dehydratase